MNCTMPPAPLDTKTPEMSRDAQAFLRSSAHRKASVRSRKQRRKDEPNGTEMSEQKSVRTSNENGQRMSCELEKVSECRTYELMAQSRQDVELRRSNGDVSNNSGTGRGRPTSVIITSKTPRRGVVRSAGWEAVDSPYRPPSYVDIGDRPLSVVSPESGDALRAASQNGLSISRAQLLFNRNDESRAPKDERRKVLEAKLEDGAVEAEFDRIPRKVTTADCSIALMPDNIVRNRYKDIQPYDSSRVRLKPKPDNPHGYINASHIRVRVKGQELWYLAAQGPLDNTVHDFWQMIWEQDVQVVAMLTDVREFGRDKCAQYWPKSTGSKHRMTFGDFVVSLQFRNDSGCFVTSGLTLRNQAEPGGARERTIWHLQFTDWPDHGCPDDVHGFLAFLEEIESVQRHIMMESQEMKGLPVLVHCTAGVGRTGVAILVEVMKTCLENNQNVDVPTVLATLRGQRMHMVQMPTQYVFVYKTLVQYLKNTRLI